MLLPKNHYEREAAGKGGETMKLMTKTLEERFAQVGSQAEEKDPLILAKFFNPCGAGTW